MMDARVRHVNIYGHDITTSKRTEAMLRQDMKMEAIGTLAGGIAHDFNNILTSILGYNHLILGDVRDPEALAMDVRQIHMAASRAKELTRQILTFSRDATDPKSPIDLAAEIFEASQFVKATVPKNITVALDLDVEGAVVMATPGMIHQIVVNLSTNAVDAIGDDHGRITLKLRRVDGGLEFSMTDTGEGIPVGMRERIFDPFFTTKEVGKGTGLGLSVVHGIVEDLGGRITVESPPEGGCRIVLRLPEADAEEALRIRSAPGCGVEGQAKDRHVLVVDDEPSIVDMLRRFFERMGHRVTATSDSNGALALVQTVGQFDLVLADHMMPGITGITLARAIADQAPGTPVVLCSGRNDKVTLEEMRAARVAAFVLKPFNLVELADTVECLLRDGRANKVN
jgi:CheY-like chemotaxis protein